MNLLVDTSVWLWVTGDHVAPRFVEYFSAARRAHQVYTTGMVRLEVMTRAKTWNELLELQLLFEDLRSVEPSSRTWNEAGGLSAKLKAQGFRLKTPKLLIASVALENNLTLVHADSDFEPLAQHEGLKTESLLHLVG